jgi:hypothetical protein
MGVDNFQKRLRTEFTQPSLGVGDGGDFFLAVMHSPLSMDRYRVYTRYGRVPALLKHEGPEPFKLDFYEKGKSPKQECISYLLELCANVKASPGRLTRLLVQLTKANLEAILEWPEPRLVLEIRYISEVAGKYCVGRSSQSYITHSRELAELLTLSRDVVGFMWDTLLLDPTDRLMEALGDKEEFKRQCTRVIQDIVAPTRTTFGLRASRSLACTRATPTSDAATGWLGMHDGENFRPYRRLSGTRQNSRLSIYM